LLPGPGTRIYGNEQLKASATQTIIDEYEFAGLGSGDSRSRLDR
jgi:hypothetical protein